jgi:hypothetical protein
VPMRARMVRSKNLRRPSHSGPPRGGGGGGGRRAPPPPPPPPPPGGGPAPGQRGWGRRELLLQCWGMRRRGGSGETGHLRSRCSGIGAAWRWRVCVSKTKTNYSTDPWPRCAERCRRGRAAAAARGARPGPGLLFFWRSRGARRGWGRGRCARRRLLALPPGDGVRADALAGGEAGQALVHVLVEAPWEERRGGRARVSRECVRACVCVCVGERESTRATVSWPRSRKGLHSLAPPPPGPRASADPASGAPRVHRPARGPRARRMGGCAAAHRAACTSREWAPTWTTTAAWRRSWACTSTGRRAT